MDENEIKDRVGKLRTKEDLLDLLNSLKVAEYGEGVHLFTMKQLNFYCNPKYGKRYQSFRIPKKKKGEFRTISAPVAALKSIQHFINVILSVLYKPTDVVTGFVKNKSVVDNALRHVGMNYVLNIDLENFFPSIPQVRIWWLLQQKPYGFSKEIANVIAGLCAIKQPKKEVQSPKNAIEDYDYVLPQGSPTSPILSNISCEHLDHKLQKLARSFGMNYSRYADDITFSSEEYVYSRKGKFWTQLRRIISEHKFSINENKTRLLRKGVRQEVTGLTVNKTANVSKKYIKEIRRHLNTWEKYGYAIAFKNFYPNYKLEKGHVKKGEPDLMNVLSGKLLYLKMVRGESDPVYIKLNTRFKNLTTGEDSSIVFGSMSYHNTQKVTEFEKTMDTEIKINRTQGTLKSYFFETKSIATKKRRKKENSPSEPQVTKVDVRISENANFEHKKDLFISLCRNEKGETFYLMHKELFSTDEKNERKLELDKMLSALVRGGKVHLEVLEKDIVNEEKPIYEDTMSVVEFEKKHRCKVELSEDKKYAVAKYKVKRENIKISPKVNPEEYREHSISKYTKGSDSSYYLIHRKPRTDKK